MPATSFDEKCLENRALAHPNCLFSKSDLPLSRDLTWNFDKEGHLHGRFTCSKLYQGYTGVIHGGIISACIDISMTHFLFGHGVVGYTADLNITYKKPLKTAIDAQILVTLKKSEFDALFTLSTSITQEGILKVLASGRFLRAKDQPGNITGSPVSEILQE
ncbi:MAG: hotdog domain-containing protein [Candidatus Ozemobacteraceae bacterium]